MPAPSKPSFNFNPAFLFDAIVIGAGPAGLSTALALCRVKRTAVVFSNSQFRNDKAHRAHTMLSRDHQPASEIRQIGKEQIDKYGTTHFVERVVVRAWKDEEANVFEVEDGEGEKWRGKKIVLAMGARDVLPSDIEGYEECWGQSIFHCLFCDGIERSGRPAAMLGFESAMSLHLLGFMVQIGCPSVTILSNGPLRPQDDSTAKALEVAKAMGAKVDERRIQRLIHLDDEQGIDVVFEDDQKLRIGFLQHTPPTEVTAPNLAKDLGVEILPDGRSGTMLKRNEPFGATNVDGVLVAGDACVLMKQSTLAMTQGGAAGAGVAFMIGQDEARDIAEAL